jgi:5-formyltetrahydrofolate cyclo-ligase
LECYLDKIAAKKEKALLRKIIQVKRDKIPDKLRQELSRAVTEKFLSSPEYLAAGTILMFYPFRSETDITPAINSALKDNKKVVLPKIEQNRLQLYYINDTSSDLVSGYMGILEPLEGHCIKASPRDIDLAVIPGVCFDKNMNRLGYGGGFYDRLVPGLPENVIKIAMCFDFQVLDSIAADIHDKKIDKIITEKNTYYGNAGAGLKRIAILIAAYNEEKYIEEVLKNCIKTELDTIIVDDGSVDSTAAIIERLIKIHAKKEPQIFLLKHEKNMGKGQALKTGFNFSLKNNYSGVITLDADGQHDTAETIDFIRKVESERPDIIVGSRLGSTKDMPFIRLATNVFTSWLISVIASKKIADVQSGFRYIGKRVIENIKLETGNFDTEPELLLKASWMDYKIINIPISTIYHKDFTSHVNPVRDTVKFFRMVIKSIFWKIKFKRSYTRL